ncbi:hypothetical protein [Kribbella solani]|uniref:Uncharacterized protein n=1 Tax=Kribbella solani TaxID=236067 RepID=A0A841E1C6_9ACTN|nr:hypothetical protein [Kribbella solani]MBB5984021.1 hypothetical protein [Kribbella solani]
MTTDPAPDPAPGPAMERTAPRSVDDCPAPRSEYVDLREAWKDLGRDATIRRADDLLREEPDLRSKILTARNLQWACKRFLEAAVFGLLDEGADPDEIAELTGHPADSIRDDVDQDRKARIRRDYSVAYYKRHPDRTPNQWYAVEDDDPVLPELPIGVRTREATRPIHEATGRAETGQ